MQYTFRIGDAQQSARTVDANGYLHVANCPISSWGVFQYGRGQVGDTSGPANEIIGVFRPESSVNDPDVWASFENAPIIDDHTYLDGTISDDADGMAPEEKGVDGVLTNVRYDSASGWMIGDVTIYSRTLQKKINDGKRELSLGYKAEFTPKKGVFDGKPYEYEQGKLIGNHLAVVDKARVSGAKILDAHLFTNQEGFTDMPRKIMDETAIEELKKLLPALQEFLNEEAAEPAHQTEMTPDELAENANSEEPAVVQASEQSKDLSELKDLLKALLMKLEEAPVEDEVSQEEVKDETPAELDPTDKGVETGDAMFKRLYADLAAKDKLYSRVSRIVGAFDHSEMTHKQVAEYSAKKVGLVVSGDAAIPAIEAYLKGAEVVSKKSAEVIKTADAAINSELQAYLNGSKK